MRKIIKDCKVVESEWIRVGMEDTIPEEGNVIVPFTRWKAKKESFASRKGALGVCLDGDDNARELAPFLDEFALVAILFPKFADGRGYSHARILRDEIGYRGELRAVGDILRDQLFYLARCGFNALEIREDKDIEEALEAFKDFSVTYQAAADTSKPIYRR